MKNVFKILAVVIVVFSVYAFTAKDNSETIKVVIDVAHGGKDLGATGNGFSEKDIVSQISGKIKAMNKNSNVNIYFTRTEDNLLTLQERAQMINDIKPDLFLSLHVNNNKEEVASGIECFVANESFHKAESLVFAEELIIKLSKATNLKSLGHKSGPFYILKNTNCPGVLLELGFLSNENDRKYITDDKNQDVIAKTILEFISQIK